jgi:hypothetical protein
MFNTIAGAEAVGAGAASCYGSDSDQMVQLLAAPAPDPQHWLSKYAPLEDGMRFLTLSTI